MTRKDPLAAELFDEYLGGAGELMAAHEKIDVAEHSVGRVVVTEVGESDALQDAELDPGRVERIRRAKEDTFHTKSVSEPRRPTLFYVHPLLLRNGKRTLSGSAA